MAEALSWTVEEQTLLLAGELQQSVLNPLWDARNEVMQGIRRIDLSRVSRVDTGGLALLVHLIALGNKQGTPVILVGVSENMLTLAQLYNLPEDVLPR